MAEGAGSDYQVIISRKAKRALRRLPDDVLRRVDQVLLGLAKEPWPQGCVKLVGFERLYRLRVGDWRIVYAVEEGQLIVLVIEIAPRGEVYRNL